jgi:predicted nucleic acid-binding protein
VASIESLPRTRRLILDTGGILALVRLDLVARAALERAVREGYVVVIPTPVLAQVHRGGHDLAHVDRVVNMVDALPPTSALVARRAGELQAKAGTSDAIDAIVAAEALESVPSLILTSDPGDLERLLEGEPEAARVVVIRV